MIKYQKYPLLALLFLVFVIAGLVKNVSANDEPIPTDKWISVYCAEPFMNDMPMQPGDTIRA